ncbi:MAG: transcriptional repressor NrdR [Deltaproteobacteria bacterium]|nr:transcriptional repressor NrdR [Deltaproteobacteria bacterium]MBW2050902.1 transcriptional repressor NrdR [Deltaproteobacteria bacterium]MBW2139561.1 transcriptional repressor NrdR [Deltaproteobacteria bacterium]MBW2322604.1 transcriptional repressor NrdR [Deltaproteobacteria bacterium]
MKCPFCLSLENKVIDSRLSKDGLSIRRRRECLSCNRRFTTYERLEEIQVMVIKSDGRREPFDRDKVKSGLLKATQKRPISVETIDDFISTMERQFQEANQKEIPSKEIGERVMVKLHEIDEVAYVRFASVYREFKDLGDFVRELKDLLASRGEKAADQALANLDRKRKTSDFS